MKQSLLPILENVIFVDWHGVLSCDPFWASILEKRKHPLRSRLEAKLKEIFSQNSLSDEWMKGVRSSGEIIASMELDLDCRFGADFLNRRLDEDCRRMRVNVELFKVLQGLLPRSFVVVATDNVDCFVRSFERVRSHARRHPALSETLASWAMYCDDIVCSSDVGKLKSEDPAGFFGAWLSRHKLGFPDALLIDDRADNCAAFERHGGKAVQWKMGAGELSEVVEAVERWMQSRIRDERQAKEGARA